MLSNTMLGFGMSSLSSFRKSTGFTLIELIAVIAIIGILAALLFPTITGIQNRAKQAQAASNIRQITLAYLNFTSGGGVSRRMTTANTPSIYVWAARVARYGDMNEASLYFVDGDPAHENLSSIPGVVLEDVSRLNSIHPDFINSPLSYTVSRNLPISAPATTTPVIWTRGLQKEGDWAPDSPFGGRVGHMGFLDGHVSQFDTLRDEEGGSSGLLLVLESQPIEKTTDIAHAVGGSSNVLEPAVLTGN